MSHIFIGLGGTGTKIIDHTAAAIRQAHGDAALERCRFIALDTCVTDLESFTHRVPSRLLRTVRVGDVSGPQILERWKVEHSPAEIDKFFYSWFPARDEPGETQIGGFGEGAQGIRVGGRLAFFYNAERFVDALRSQIGQLREISKEHGQKLDGGDLSIFLCASLSNGTGGGCFLDVANMVRRVMRTDQVQGNYQVSGVFFTGEVAAKFHKGSGAANVAARWRRNGIHCLVETDYWLRSQAFRETRGGTREYDLEYPSVKEKNLRVDRVSELEGELFTAVYLVGPANANGHTLATYDHYVRIAAESMVGLSLTHAARMTDEYPELKRPDEDGSPRKYASLGRVRLSFPVDPVRKGLGGRVAGQAVRGTLGSPDRREAAEDAKQFAAQHRLDVEATPGGDRDPTTGAMAVLEAPRARDEFRNLRAAAEAVGLDAESGADVRRGVQELAAQLEPARTRYRAARDDTLEEHAAAADGALLGELATLTRERGLGWAKGFLDALLDHLDAVAGDLFRVVDKRRRDPDRRGTLDDAFVESVEDLVEGVGRFPLGRTKRLRAAQDQAAADLVDRVNAAMVEDDMEAVHGLIAGRLDEWRRWAVRLARLVEEVQAFADGLGREEAPQSSEASLAYVAGASNARFLQHLSEEFDAAPEVKEKVPRFLAEMGEWAADSFLAPGGPLAERRWDGAPGEEEIKGARQLVDNFVAGLLPDDSDLLPKSLEEGLRRYIDWMLAPFWSAADRGESAKAREILDAVGKEDPLVFHERARERVRRTLESGEHTGPARRERDRKDLAAELIDRLAEKAAPWLGVPEQAWDAGPKTFLRLNEARNPWLKEVASAMTEAMAMNVEEAGAHELVLTTFAGGSPLKALFPVNRYREDWESSFDDLPPPWPDKRYYKTPIKGGTSWFHDPWEGSESAQADKILLMLSLLYGLEAIDWQRKSGKDRLVAAENLGEWVHAGTNLGLGWEAAVTQVLKMDPRDQGSMTGHLEAELRRIWSAGTKSEGRAAVADLLRPAQKAFNERRKGAQRARWDGLFRFVTNYLDSDAPERIDEVVALFAPGA